jgi:hypothetical protein
MAGITWLVADDTSAVRSFADVFSFKALSFVTLITSKFFFLTGSAGGRPTYSQSLV